MADSADAVPSPFEDAGLYDLLFEGYQEDLGFWWSFAKEGDGPVLDLGCGTGRVLIPLLKANLDADGLDLYRPMLERAQHKAAKLGYRPHLEAAPMHSFKMPRKYRRILCAFNAFAHNLTTDDQLATLRCCRDHLDAKGAVAIHLSIPRPEVWMGVDGEPVLELELPLADRGTKLQLYDTRTKNYVEQTQRSDMEIRELDAQGKTVRSTRSTTDVRWVGKNEMELLLRLAGFSRYEILGGFDRRALDKNSDTMIAVAWR